MTFFDSRHQRAALVLTLLAIALAIALAPYASGLIAVPVLYVVLRPLHAPVSRIVGVRLASLLMVALTVVLIVLPGISIVGLLVDRAQSMAGELISGPVLRRLRDLEFGPFDVGSRLVALSEQVVTWLGSNALRLVGTATRFALNLVLALFGLYYLLINGGEVWAAVRPYIPFSETNAEKLRMRFRDVTTSTVIGTGLTAVAQAIAVSMSFLLTGLTDPLFWGVVTLVFAILPVLGSGMVWIPGVAVHVIGGHPGAAFFMLAWNLAATGLIDYGIRPMVFNRFAQIHPLITLVGAVAGVSYFGLLGLLVGPLALTYFFEIVRMYREEHVETGTVTGFPEDYAPAQAPVVEEPSPPAADRI